jgi:G3E family GTPase
MGDTAVVINEFGEIGLDHLLVAASPDDVVQLPNGCLCCAVRQDLVRTLHGLLARRASADLAPFRRVVVETSGLAEPAPILYTLAADPHLERTLRFDTVLTVVDAIAGSATLERFAEATAQAVVADRLLISKTDLASAPEALLAGLAALNPAAEIVHASELAEPAAALFRAAVSQPRRPARRLWSAGAHSHGIATVAIELRAEMTRLDFAKALGGLARERGEDLLRVKGIIGFADVPSRPAAIHAVQHTLYPPEWFTDWPDADRRSRLVFITRNISSDEILSRFAAGAPVVMG